MSITYRKYDLNNEDEIKFIAQIDAEIPALYDSDFTADEKTILERLDFIKKSIKPDDFYEVAVTEQNQVVGFHFVKKIMYLGKIPAGSVYTLWVHPDYRGQGIATSLKVRSEDWARLQNLDHIHLGLMLITKTWSA